MERGKQIKKFKSLDPCEDKLLEEVMLDEDTTIVADYDPKNEASAGGEQQRKHKGEGNPSLRRTKVKNQSPFHLEFTTSTKKPHLRWTPPLHERFEKAVTALGGPFKATPMLVLDKMRVDGLNLMHIKSHLQKYRHAKTPDSNSVTTDPHSNSEQNLFAGSSSNMPVFAAFRAASVGRKSQQASSTEIAMQTSIHMNLTQRKKKTCEETLTRYPKSIGQRTINLCDDQENALLEMVDLLSAQNTSFFELDDHSINSPKNLDLSCTVSTSTGLERQPSSFLLEKSVSGQTASPGINLEEWSFLPEQPIDIGAMPDSLSLQRNDWDHDDLIDCLLPQNMVSMLASNEGSPSSLQAQAVDNQPAESIMTLLSVESDASNFQPPMISNWEVEDAAIPRGLDAETMK